MQVLNVINKIGKLLNLRDLENDLLGFYIVKEVRYASGKK